MTNNRFNATLRNRLKSGIDRIMAAIALIVFSPVMVGVAIALHLQMGRPILFAQPRPGKHCRIFTMYKFRTMTNECDQDGNLLPDSKRLTTLGEFLRRTSLDELPQFWNVLRGEMSLVGPRPLAVVYLDRYSPEQMRRHEVLPGITGWAQVNGRNNTTWEERLAADVWYVDHQSLWLDLKIVATTFWKVFRREGVSEPGGVTMSEFKGTQLVDRQG